VLITEFVSHPPRDERTIKAIARMNYLHSGYQKTGKILQDDLLYTLSVFITEPISWVSRFEWRSHTQMEMCAISTFWKGIGDNMGIEYNKLRRFDQGWKDGIEFYEDIKEWAEMYEIDEMVPALSNKITADETTSLLLFLVPEYLKHYGIKVIGVLMGDRLRKAMMYADPPQIYYPLVEALIAVRKCVLRYLSLPRPSFMRVREVGDAPDPKTGRYFHKNYQAHPFYNKPGFLNRWGPEAWLVWASGKDIPGTKGDLYMPGGFLFEEVGPRGVKGKGLDAMKANEDKLRVERPTGCPFAFAKEPL